MASLSRSCSSGDFAGGNSRYAARAPLKALASAAASLKSAVNASAPLSTKRCSRPVSRPMTRTFWPFERRKLATIEPVWPVAPKTTYISFETTGELIVTISLVLPEVRRTPSGWLLFLRPSFGEGFAEHGKAAQRLGLGCLVLQNVPMLFEKPVFEPDNVGCDPGGGPSHPREASMRYDVIAFCDDELVLIMQRLRYRADEIEQAFATWSYVCAVLNVVR